MNTVLNFIKQLDKQLHMMGCFALTVTLGYWLTPWLGLNNAVRVAAVLTLVLGALKEIYDYKHPLIHTADIMDFVADVIGAWAGVFVLLAPVLFIYVKGML